MSSFGLEGTEEPQAALSAEGKKVFEAFGIETESSDDNTQEES